MRLEKLKGNKSKATYYIDNFSVGTMLVDEESDGMLYYLQYDIHQKKKHKKPVRLTLIGDYGVKDLLNTYIMNDETDTKHINYDKHIDKTWKYVENIYNTILQQYYANDDTAEICYYDEKTFNEAREKLESAVRDICQPFVDSFADSVYTENEDRYDYDNDNRYDDEYDEDNEYDEDDYDEDGYNARKDYEDYLDYYYEEYGNEDE